MVSPLTCVPFVDSKSMINGLKITSQFVSNGLRRTRCVLDDTLLVPKLILLDHMPELDCCVLLGVRRMIERNIHHLRRGDLVFQSDR